MPRSLACSPVARQPLARQSFACLLARLLARSSARSLALPHLPPARPSTSPPQTHDCPAVMGLRLIFVSGGGSPWFNVDWSFNHAIWRQRQRQQQQQWRRRGDGGGGCGGYCGSGHSSAVLGTPCVPWAAVEAPAAGPSLPVTLSATSSASCPPGAASPHSRRVQATALLLRFRCACRYIMCRRVARTGRTEYTVRTGSV